MTSMMDLLSSMTNSYMPRRSYADIFPFQQTYFSTLIWKSFKNKQIVVGLLLDISNGTKTIENVILIEFVRDCRVEVMICLWSQMK